MDKLLYDRRVDVAGDFYFNLNVCNKNNKVMLHMHNSIELKFIIEGKYLATVAGKQVLCERGDVLFVNSRCPHAYETVGSSINYVLVVDLDIFKAVCPKGKTFPLKTSLGDNFKYLERILAETEPVWKTMKSNEKRGFVFRILGTLLQYNKLIDEEVVKEDVMIKIIDYIKTHCNEDMSLETLAKTFGYTRNYFSNLINTNLHMGLRECINRFRIEKAVQLISQAKGKMPLCNVAQKCGYESMNTFYRSFRRYASDISLKES